MTKKFKVGIDSDGDLSGQYLRSNNSSGDEGGEIFLAKPQTNTTLDGTGVTIDVYQNKLRFFEQGGSARGYYIDITNGGSAASTNLVSAGGASLTQEEVQDYVAPLFTHSNHTNASVTYEDASNELHIDVTNAPSAGYTAVLKHDVRLASAIAKGQAVYVSSANGTNMIVSKASNASEATSSKTMGLLESGGATNALVKVVTEGLLAGLDTSAANSEGDPVWLGTDGNLIYGLANKPYAPDHLVFIGVVTRKNNNNGEIFVKVQNGFELDELHNVGIGYGNSIEDNEVLAYDLSSGLWKNQTSVEAGLIDTSATEQTKAGNLIISGDLTVATDILSTGINLVISNDEVVALNTANNNAGISEDTGFSITTNGVAVPNVWVFNNNGNFTFPDATNQTTAFLGMASYDTDDLAEGSSNLYFTDARARTALSADLGGTNGGIRIIAPSSTADATLSNDSATHQVIVGPSGNGTNIKGTMTILASPSIADPGNLGVAGYIDAAGSVTGSSIIKDGGTSSEFLKADGSVDTNTYLTTSSASSTYATITSLSNYLTTSDASTTYLTQSAATSTYQPIGSYLTSYTETDPIFIASEAYNITSTDTTNWDTAYGWGNHSSAGYLITETDPVFLASEAYTITSTDTSNWDTAYGWGDHSTIGYLTSYSETSTLSDITGRGSTTSNAIEITNATASSSHTTGALIVSGGVGIGEDLYVNNNIYVGGNINITGSITGDLTSVDVTNLVVTDPLIYLAEGNPDDSVDIGIFAALNHGGPSYSHTGLIRDASDSGKWKLASGLSDPTSNVINFTGATFDTLKIGALEVVDSSTTRTNLGLAIGTNVQAYNATLAAVAGGTYTGDDSITTLGTITTGTWSGTTIGYTKGGTGLTTLGTAGQVLKVNSGATGLEWGTVTSGSSFTNSSELAALLSDETGTGLVVFNNTPSLTSPEISGGTINNASIGATTASTGKFTSVDIDGGVLIKSASGTTDASISYSTTSYNAAEFIIFATTSAGSYTSKVLMLASGGLTPTITEYAILTQGTAPTVTITPGVSGTTPNYTASLSVSVSGGTSTRIIATQVAV